ncbi:immunity protein YezG family protein [Bacillus sp. FSL W7-1360]
METQVESYYQKLADLIVAMIPEEWTELKFYAQEDSEGAQKFFFYYRSLGTGEWVYNMAITEKFQFPEEDFDELICELSFCISDFKTDYQEEFGEVWTSFQLTLTDSGKFKLNFNYDENPLGPGKTQTIWEYEHLDLVPEDGSVDKEFLDEYLEEKAQGKRYPFLEPVKEEQ